MAGERVHTPRTIRQREVRCLERPQRRRALGGGLPKHPDAGIVAVDDGFAEVSPHGRRVDLAFTQEVMFAPRWDRHADVAPAQAFLFR